MKPNGMLILVLAVALAAVTVVAWAEGEEKPVCPLTGETATCTGDGPHGLAGRHHRPERMAAALDLSEEQREAMRDIMTEAREATRERMEVALADILTPEQLDQLEEIKGRRGARRGMERPGRMGRGGPEGGDRDDMVSRHLERMTEHLDLTSDQQEQIRQILEEAMAPPRSETREKIRAVLTPEQQEKMGRHHPRRQGMGAVEGKGRMNHRKGRDMGCKPHSHGPVGSEMGLPYHLAEQLQLTEEQRAAANELMTRIHDEQQAETRKRIETLLTPEQREKLEQLHP